MYIIKCDNISISYNKESIIENFTLDVNEGEYICIIGENGTGKTTLVKTLLGLIQPVAGKIHYNIKQNEIGYISQECSIPNNFPASVYEIVLSGCLNKKTIMPFYSKLDKEKAKKYLLDLDLIHIANKNFNSLSGGQKQRVLLARALCSTKKLILLDEPTASLDPNATQELYDSLYNINKSDGITIITVSHDIANTNKYADTIVNLSKDNCYITSKQTGGDLND